MPRVLRTLLDKMSGAAGYIKNIKFSKSTGEIVDGTSLELDQEKIDEESKYDGYYSIVTSEKELTDSEIRNIYKGLWEIEESFKIIKSEFKARPVFVKTENFISVHSLFRTLAREKTRAQIVRWTALDVLRTSV